jgi:hypothetical protein
MHEQLKDLLARLEQTLNDPESKPTWLHWSDVEVLNQAVATLVAYERREAALCRVLLGEEPPRG